MVLALAGLALWFGVASAADAEGNASQTAALTLESATPTSLTVTWDEVENANLYTIQWRLSTGTAFCGSYAATGGRHKITGLLPGREYLVRIEVADAGGVNFLRLRGTFSTPLTAARELTVTKASASSLSLSWSKPEGWNPAGYTLRWRRVGDDQFLGTLRLAGDATSRTISGLMDQTQYTVTLFALNDLGRGGMEARVTAYAVDPLRLTLNSSREVCTANTLTELSWKIAGGLLPHRLFIGGKRIDLPTVQSHLINCGPLALDDETRAPLAEQGKTFSALARDKRGVRAPAETMIELVAQGAPSLRASTAASGAVALNWSIESAIGITHWEYRKRRGEGQWGAWTKIAGSTGATTDHTVSGLTPDARYSFRLRATSGSVAGPRSGTAIAVAGMTPTPVATYLSYDVYDATDGATSSGAYAALTNADDASSGVTNFTDADTVTAVLMNTVGYAGRSHMEFLSNVSSGDTFTWEFSATCWASYEVTKLLSDPPAPARKLFAVKLTSEDPCTFRIADLAPGRVSRIVWGPAPMEPRIGADGIRILPNGYPVTGGHTFRITAQGWWLGWIVIDVPAGMRLTQTGASENFDGTITVFLRDDVSGAELGIDFGTGAEVFRYIPKSSSPNGEARDVGALFDSIVASARVQPSQ